MTAPREHDTADATPTAAPAGWEVTSPDGDVIASGPGITLQAVSNPEQDDQ